MWSFTGMMELMKKYTSKAEIKLTFQYLVNNSWFGDAAQQLERGNPELDFKIKWEMALAFMEKFSYLKKYESDLKEMADAYYSEYGEKRTKNIGMINGKVIIKDKKSLEKKQVNNIRLFP